MKSATNPISPMLPRLPLLNDGIEQALTWFEDTRLQAPRFALEAQTVMLNLRRSRIRLNGLAKALTQNGALGFYGRFQAAKTHLLTELAAAEPGYLTTVFAGKTLDFLTHIRPNNAVAGVAIRFSHQIPPEDANFLVQLTLLTEVELVNILSRAANTPHSVEKEHLADVVNTLKKLRLPQTVAGISADEIVTLWDNLRSDESSQQHTWESEYWPQVLTLAPYLSIDDRARLFSPLWGDEPDVTECYRRLAYRLQQLGNTHRVMAPLSILTDESQQPAHAILAVASLKASEERVEIKLQDRRIIVIALAELNIHIDGGIAHSTPINTAASRFYPDRFSGVAGIWR